MTVLTVISGAVGLALGESAIAQIDPLYFQGSVTPARDISQDPRPQRRPGFADASGWQEGFDARDRDCGDCPAGTMVVEMDRSDAYAAPLVAYSDPTIRPRWEETADAGDDLRIDRAIRSSDLERYLHYPISSDQEEIGAGIEGEAEVVEVDVPTGL